VRIKTPRLPSSKAGNRGPFSSLFLCAFARPFDDLRACRATLVFLVCILSFASTFPLLQLFLVSPTPTARASPTLTSLLRQPQPPSPRSRRPTLPCHAAALTRRHQHNVLTPSLLPFSSTQSARSCLHGKGLPPWPCNPSPEESGKYRFIFILAQNQLRAMYRVILDLLPRRHTVDFHSEYSRRRCA